MDDDNQIRQAADEIVRWASHHPLDEAEILRVYAKQLAGLPSLKSAAVRHGEEWGMLQLGRTAVRFLRQSVDEVSWTLLGGATAGAFATRSIASAPPCERVLQAEGRTATALVAIGDGRAAGLVNLRLWLEGKPDGEKLPFNLRTLDAHGKEFAEPMICKPHHTLELFDRDLREGCIFEFRTGDDEWRLHGKL